MNQKMAEGLGICIGTTKMLKEQFPDQIMKVTPVTVIVFSKLNKQRRLIRKSRDTMGRSYAYYSKSRKRVVIRQKTLIERKVQITRIRKGTIRHLIHDNFAMIELMCHELAHHRTKGHGAGFKRKYLRFLSYMVNQIISGDYYKQINKVIKVEE